MCLFRKKHHLYVVFFCFCLGSKSSYGVEFLPGVGLGLNYTDNAELKPEGKVSDVVAIGSVGASLAEDEGSLVYGVSGTARREKYLNDTFEDRTYYNLALTSSWDLLRERINLYMTNFFLQRPIVSLDAQTPDNIQDSNVFTFGATMQYPISGRQRISLVPQYNQYYYEVQNTDNRQYSLRADWNYQMFRLTNVAVNIGTRLVEYDDVLISNTTFNKYAFIVTGQPVHTNYSISLGQTAVERDNGQSTSGFSGGGSWQSELSSRSTIEAVVSTELTDTSSVAADISSGNPDDVQLTADVIRNSIARLTYQREDASLHTRIWAEYREIKYSDNVALSRTVQTFGAALSFPVTQLVSSGVTLGFDDVRGVEVVREDKRFNVAANVNVNFTTKLSGVFNVRYRTKESTNSVLNYDELSVFAGLSYGFGSVNQRTGPGGY